MSDITVTPSLLEEIEAEINGLLKWCRPGDDPSFKLRAKETLALVARIRELEAENAKLKYDISAYVEANSDLLEECDAARGRALEEAASLVDEYGADANHVTSNWAAGIAADIRSLITKEGE